MKFKAGCPVCRGTGIFYEQRLHKNMCQMVVFERFCPYCQEEKFYKWWSPMQEESEQKWQDFLATLRDPDDYDGNPPLPLKSRPIPPRTE